MCDTCGCGNTNNKTNAGSTVLEMADNNAQKMGVDKEGHKCMCGNPGCMCGHGASMDELSDDDNVDENEDVNEDESE